MPGEVDLGERRLVEREEPRWSPSGSPARVSTERLWSGSEETSSSRTPGGEDAAAASRATTSGRRPSLTLGTHSREQHGWECTVGRRKHPLLRYVSIFQNHHKRTPEMSYSGNPALSSDVKQRILSTFDQTLDLAREGNRQEALLGCDFVLRMDPQFQPAHLLQERLRATTGPVSVDDLTRLAGDAGPRPVRGPRGLEPRSPRRACPTSVRRHRRFCLPARRAPGAVRSAPVPGADGRRPAESGGGDGRSGAPAHPRTSPRSGWRPSPTSSSSWPRRGRRCSRATPPRPPGCSTRPAPSIPAIRASSSSTASGPPAPARPRRIPPRR